jgi:ABC-type amino acid transport system, permease component
MWENFTNAFYLNFISEDRWRYITDGLQTTLIITCFACLMGIVLGFIVGMIRSTHDKTGKLKFLNVICQIYLTVIRGTPVVVTAADHLFSCIRKRTHRQGDRGDYGFWNQFRRLCS